MFDNGPYGQGYGAHYPALAAALAVAPPGPVLELGSGNFSTPLLDAMCAATRRRLVTLDHDAAWLKRFDGLRRPDHEVRHVADWDAEFALLDASVQRWAMVFVDHAPAWRRGPDARRFASRADLVVVHDTNFDGHGNERLAEFRHRVEYTKIWPPTAVLSDVVDVPRLG